ncbi:MAG TPA: glycosyltransferase family 2 protein [Steroidobacteraceae bacterium]|jgi:glycosyltransferase involved in cell wall biosynthesis
MAPSIAEYDALTPAPQRLTGGRSAGSHRTGVDHPGRVTVITVCFNSVRTIDRTLDSIAAQTWPDVEYIVIDGASTDGTVERLRARAHEIDLWISEPDRGISDAFNKGIALASGEYVALLSSDDWVEPQHFAQAVRGLSDAKVEFVYGDLMFHPADARPPYVFVGEQDYGLRLPHTMPDLNHPTVVCRRRLYAQHGLYDIGLRVAMDYEWFLRGFRQGVRGAYVPGLITHMSMEGISHRQFRRGLAEVRDVSVQYGYPRTRACARHLIRLLRPEVRRLLEKLMPRAAYVWIRSRLNPNYRPLGGHTP